MEQYTPARERVDQQLAMDNRHNTIEKNPMDGSRTWTLTVSKNYDDISVQVAGQMPNLDEGISMLQQAIRALEFEKKKQDVLQVQNALMEQARTARVLNGIKVSQREV
jgi:hypothetical protein